MDLKPVLVIVEKIVQQEIEAKSDLIIDKALLKLAELIPGKLDDMALAQVAPLIKAQVKAELLKQADKIDGEVG